MITFNSHVLASVDVETTGTDYGFHDLVQVSVLPLTPDLDPIPDVSPFYINIKPDCPARATKMAMKVNGLDLVKLESAMSKEQAADVYDEWHQGLGLPLGKRLIPLIHNSPFDVPFLKIWLGNKAYGEYFTCNGRDSMFTALAINDTCAWKGRPIPFPSVGIKGLCKKFGITLDDHHDALADCIVTAKIYKELLRYEY